MSDWKIQLAKKSDKELEEIIENYKDEYTDVLEALIEALKRRNLRTDVISILEDEKNTRNDVYYKVAKKIIKPSLSFKWTPKSTKQISTDLPSKLIVRNLMKAIRSLRWYIVYFDENRIEAKRSNDLGDLTEKIIINIKGETVLITSTSIKNNICDFGKNNRRVFELITAYKEFESKYDDGRISQELIEIEKKEEENKYKVPNELTKPKRIGEPKSSYLLFGGLITSLILGAILALFSGIVYIIVLYDSGIGILTAIVLGYFIKLSNISDFKKLQWIGFSSIALTYLFSHIVRFIYIVETKNISNVNLFDYLTSMLEHGIQYKNLNLGAIGLIIAWIIEVAIAIFVYQFRIAQNIIKYDIERAPKDVVEFAIYWFNENKTEEEVRQLLSQKGWYDKLQQDIIIKAVGALSSLHDLERA